jgi:hypothetical protein
MTLDTQNWKNRFKRSALWRYFVFEEGTERGLQYLFSSMAKCGNLSGAEGHSRSWQSRLVLFATYRWQHG